MASLSDDFNLCRHEEESFTSHKLNYTIMVLLHCHTRSIKYQQYLIFPNWTNQILAICHIATVGQSNIRTDLLHVKQIRYHHDYKNFFCMSQCNHGPIKHRKRSLHVTVWTQISNMSYCQYGPIRQKEDLEHITLNFSDFLHATMNLVYNNIEGTLCHSRCCTIKIPPCSKHIV
jgi:hypothetical protein